MAAYEWLASVQAVRHSVRKLALHDERYLEVRYEQLVDRPKDVLGDIEAFVGIGADEQMRQYGQEIIRVTKNNRSTITLPSNLFLSFCSMQEELGYECKGIIRR